MRRAASRSVRLAYAHRQRLLLPRDAKVTMLRRPLSSKPHPAGTQADSHPFPSSPFWWGALAMVMAGGGGVMAATALMHETDIHIETDKDLPDMKENTTAHVAEYKLARQNTTRRVQGSYQYVIIGAGTTAYAAIETIYSHQPDAEILIISSEGALPQPDVFRHYSLSPAILHSYNEWRRHITSKLESEPDAYSSSAHLTLLLTKEKDIRLDVDKQRVLLEDGTVISYGRCLIATAGRPRGLWALDRRKVAYSLRDRINTCSTIYDFEQLDSLHNVMANKQVAVVGGGFLGTELALALSGRGRDTGMTVAQVYAEPTPLARYVPLYLGRHVQRLLQSAGVRCVPERLVTDIKEGDEDAGGALRMSLMGWNKETIYTDYAVLAPTHVDPCVDVAIQSGLEVDPTTGGISVNQQLETVGNVFVAGGVASYYDAALGRRRVEMFDHSINSGILAGHNMTVKETTPAGQPQARLKRRYTHQPMFRSQLHDIDVVCDAVGEINSKMRTVGIWVNNRRDAAGNGVMMQKGGDDNLDFQRGIVYYLEDNKVKGILLWNASDYLERAREVLRVQPQITGVKSLKRQIALAPDSWLHVIQTDAL